MQQRPFPVVNLGQILPPAFTAAQERFVRAYEGQFGIVAVGDGYRDGRLVIEVMTTDDPEAIAAVVPGEFMGFPVVVRHSGEIRLQGARRMKQSLGTVVPRLEMVLEHHGKRVTVRGMIDSGSDFMASIENPDVIKSLGLVATRSAKAMTTAGIIERQMARIDGISIGPCKVSNVEVQLNPMTEEERGLEDMTVGEPFLKMTSGSLDFTPEGFKFVCPLGSTSQSSPSAFPVLPVAAAGLVAVTGIVLALVLK